MIRVRVSAASPVVRAGLEALLQGAPLITLVDDGTADVVVAEMHSQLLGAMPLHENDNAHRPALVLLVEDAVDDSAAWSAALRSGARAVLPVGASAEQIHAAVHAAAAGLTTLTPELAGSLLDNTHAALRPLTAFVEHLSPREAEILAMLAEGLGNKTIAARLRISRNTVKAHVSAIFAKLGASTRAEAVAIGARSGLIVL